MTVGDCDDENPTIATLIDDLKRELMEQETSQTTKVLCPSFRCLLNFLDRLGKFGIETNRGYWTSIPIPN